MAKDSRKYLLNSLLGILSFAGFIQPSVLQSTKPSYVAGVVEFRPATEGLSTDMLNSNLAHYRDIIQSVEALQTDIIVFPECTLNNDLTLTYVPNPKDSIVPCDSDIYKDFLRDISCYAKNAKKYIVINVGEKENCTKESQEANGDPRPCSLNGLTTYNTNVVFNRNGEVISRYRKVNLYQENRNTTYKPEVATFETDFGVTFGLITCFDILFYTPSMKMIKAGITDFIYPTMWFSELPFLTAVQTQQSWAYANDVHLLAAGASRPEVGSTGTGIYSGINGALVSVMNTKAEQKIYVATVQKKNYQNSSLIDNFELSQLTSDQLRVQNPRSIMGIHVIRDYRINEYKMVPLNTENSSLLNEQSVCHNEFCCRFVTNITTWNSTDQETWYQYRLAAFAGERSYQNISKSIIKICAILSCQNETLESCGTMFENTANVRTNLIFESIQIEADLPMSEELLIQANTVDANLLPFLPAHYELNKTDSGNNHHVAMKLVKPKTELLTFGIYANYFDGTNTNSAPFLQNLSTFIIGSSFIIFISNLY